MGQPLEQPWSLEEFFSWQELQEERYELVNGRPLRMMSGAKNVHDDIVMNITMTLGPQVRNSGCRPFSGDGSVETYPGQIRRPDFGVDCGRRDREAYKAASPRLVVEVLSPSTRDLPTIRKLEEYKALASLDYILLVEPNTPEARVWSRDEAREWRETEVVGLDASIPLPSLSASLDMRAVYDGVEFPAKPRLLYPD